jgi:hypothetical protein
MTITDSGQLIIGVDGRTLVLTKEEIAKAFREPKASCANYERDNTVKYVEYYVGIDSNVEKCNDPIVERVRQKLLDRSQVGIKKYGKTVDQEVLKPSEWLEHAIQEGLDKVIYMTKLKQDLEKEEETINQLVNKYTNDQELGREIRKIYSNIMVNTLTK